MSGLSRFAIQREQLVKLNLISISSQVNVINRSHNATSLAQNIYNRTGRSLKSNGKKIITSVWSVADGYVVVCNSKDLLT